MKNLLQATQKFLPWSGKSASNSTLQVNNPLSSSGDRAVFAAILFPWLFTMALVLQWHSHISESILLPVDFFIYLEQALSCQKWYSLCWKICGRSLLVFQAECLHCWIGVFSSERVSLVSGANWALSCAVSRLYYIHVLPDIFPDLQNATIRHSLSQVQIHNIVLGVHSVSMASAITHWLRMSFRGNELQCNWISLRSLTETSYTPCESKMISLPCCDEAWNLSLQAYIPNQTSKLLQEKVFQDAVS